MSCCVKSFIEQIIQSACRLFQNALPSDDDDKDPNDPHKALDIDLDKWVLNMEVAKLIQLNQSTSDLNVELRVWAEEHWSLSLISVAFDLTLFRLYLESMRLKNFPPCTHSHGVVLSASPFLCLHTPITASLCGQLGGVGWAQVSSTPATGPGLCPYLSGLPMRVSLCLSLKRLPCTFH